MPERADLSGKLALVTGGARNIGKAIATALVQRGAHVIVNYFHAHEQAKATEAELSTFGEVELLRASVAQADQVSRMFAQIQHRHGRLDILVNNAASGALVTDDEVTDEQLDKGWDTNVKGALRCARHAAKLMSGGGAIVNISALGGAQFVMANYLACAPAKAAMESLTRYLAARYASQGIRVNTASAAMLVSEVADAFPNAERMQRAIAGATPFGRLGTPAEFADLVTFLAGDDSRWVTGQTVLADGGLSLGVPLLSAPPGEPAPGDPVPVELSAQPVEPVSVASFGEPVSAESAHEIPGTADEAATPNSRSSASRRAPSMATGTHESGGPDGIAVVGMGMAVAGANSPEEFWNLRRTGADLFIPVPADRWDRDMFHSTDDSAEDKSYQDRCVFITDFQPTAGVTAADQEFTTAWLRHSIVQAVRGVHIRPGDRFRALIGYTPDGNQHLEEAGVLAATTGQACAVLAELDPENDETAERVRRVLARRYRLGAGEHPARFLPHRVGRAAVDGVLPPGAAVQMVDTACSSSLYAVDIGAKALLDGVVDAAVCGGAFALGPRGTVLFSKLHGLSRRGEVRSLDRDADGVIFADGAAVVVLKRLSRARADGDRILAELCRTGTSSDGRGKAIYAPNPRGQERAIARARAGEPPVLVDWLIAHATGTPAGDLAELSTLHRYYGDESIPITSNKSLIGHTGWAAGVVSVIEAILGLKHGEVPPQFRFTAPPAEFPTGETRLFIPIRPQQLPARDDRVRTVAVTGFGFGGTNAHILVSEPRAASPAPPVVERPRRRIAVVGWAAQLPGLADRDAVRSWLCDEGAGPLDSFGERYPTPSLRQVRLPPPTVRTVDRCQLMILECGHQLRQQLGDTWKRYAERTGVFVGHLGPTRAGMLYANRCYQDDISATLGADPELATSPLLPKLVQRLRENARRLVPPSNEDSFSGIMPNIISARVANYFDLHGPNMTLDGGLASTLSAFDVACQYLRYGDIDVALVGGINGNNLPELHPLLVDLLPNTEPAEGAFLFALADEEVAATSGLPVLGWVDDIGTAMDTGGLVTEPSAECGIGAPRSARYLGAAGGLEVLRALLIGRGPAGVVCHGEPDTPATWLNLTTLAGQRAPLEPALTDPDHIATGEPCRVRRCRPELVESPAVLDGNGEPFLAPGVVLLTDRPQLVAALGPLPEDSLVLCCGTVAPPPGWVHLPEVTADAVAAALAGRKPRRLRVLADLSASAPPKQCLTEPASSLDRLHELAFLALQRSSEASAIVVLLDALPDGVPHPYTGLFTGLVKAAYLEAPHTCRFVLVTDGVDAAAGMRAAQRESGARRTLPVVYDRAGRRHVSTLVEQPVPLTEPVESRLGPESVVVAVGGARGITAELVKAIAQRFRPTIYLLGSNPVYEYPSDVFSDEDEQFAARRKVWLREQLSRRPGTSVRTLNREYNRMIDARHARANIDEITAAVGAGKVHYVACDVTDPDDSRRAIDGILATQPRIDLLINAAGRNSSAMLERKDFDEFRQVRDVKLCSHRNLKRALAGRPVGTWCSFGSLLGYFGQRGEADYASGNDFLATAAEYAARVAGADEVTIGWTLWGGAGMGAAGLTNAYYERVGSYSTMTVSEGIHHFLRELHASHRDAYVVHIGDAERATVADLYPGFLDPSREVSPRDGFYLRQRVRREPDGLVYECPMSLASDGYLRGHTVRGHPTLPGLFVTEIAAEAALSLRPDWYVIGFADLSFDRFVQVREDGRGGTAPKRIHATVAHVTESLVTVDVRITSDVVSPLGVLAARDKPHFRCRVLLSPEFGRLHWQPWMDDPDERPVPDPYHLPGSIVSLTGPFACTRDTRMHPRGKRARFSPKLAVDGPVWSQFRMPALLLDGMARMSALHLLEERRMPIAVPTAIRRIDLYQQANDIEIGGVGPIELYATPREFALHDSSTNRFVAARTDGRALAQIKDVQAKVLGYIDTIDRTFHTAGEADD